MCPESVGECLYSQEHARGSVDNPALPDSGLAAARLPVGSPWTTRRPPPAHRSAVAHESHRLYHWYAEELPQSTDADSPCWQRRGATPLRSCPTMPEVAGGPWCALCELLGLFPADPASAQPAEAHHGRFAHKPG